MSRCSFFPPCLLALLLSSGLVAAEGDDPALVPLLEDEERTSSPVTPGAASIDPALREVDHLVERGDYERARRVVRAHLALHPGDLSGRQLLLRIDIAEREAEIRDMVAEQADMNHEVLGHPAYEAEKALAVGIERQRLDMVEYLVSLKRYEDALRMVNAMLTENPEQMAALQMKSRLLERIRMRERDRLKRERDLRRLDLINDVIEAGIAPEEPERIPRTVLIFDEDIQEQERVALQAKLREPVPFMQFEEASLSAVLNNLFMIADINYIVSDQALGEETLTINVQDSTVESVLTTVQRMLPVRFNYHAGSVYVTDNENPVLVTDIYRLKSGLTDVLRQVNVSSGTAGRGGVGQTGRGGGQQAQAQAAAAAAAAGGGGGGSSDLERLMETIEGGELTDWPEGSKLYLERKSNTLYIRSSPAVVSEVKRLLQAIDYTSVQVLIETKFVEVSDEAERQLGVDWGVAGEVNRPDGGVVWGGASGTPPLPLEGGGNQLVGDIVSSSGLSIGAIGFGDDVVPNFSARINALESKNEANLLSEPKVLTLSNGTGMIAITRDVPYIADYENRSIGDTVVLNDGSTSGNNANDALVPRFESATEGFTLQVMPSVARNSDIITLYLVPKITEVELRSVDFAAGVTGQAVSFPIENPVVRERTLQTTLHIRDGQTIVLGGLITEETSRGRNGVPGISDVPGLGRLFRTDNKDSRRSKLLIFVSAHIIDPSGSKYSDEVRHLRDTAAVVLPADVQAAARAERGKSIEAARERARQAAADEDAANGEGNLIQRPGKGPRGQ